MTANTRSVLAALVVAGVLPVAPASASRLRGAAKEPAYHATSWLRAHNRGFDQLHNADYQQRMMPINMAAAQGEPGWERPFFTDPYVAEQGPQRADWLDVSFPNRYGATLKGTLIAPKRGGPYPGVVIEPGGTGPYYPIFNLAQSIAEAGYVVLLFRAQGDHDRDSIDGYDPAPPDPDPATSYNDYCRPHNFRHWQEPGEGGLTSSGPCAGEDSFTNPPEATPLDSAGGLLTIAEASATDDMSDFQQQLDEGYRDSRARKAYGVLDAVRWMTTDADPFRARLDAAHIGAAGHSLGAHGALVAGQIDQRHQIDAVVSWDGFGPLDDIAPRVPTMFQHSEARLIGPHHTHHDPDELPGARAEAAFRAAGVPTALVTLANSTHQAWSYIPYWSLVVGDLVLNASAADAEAAATSSRASERVALYYTLAWFDRYLKQQSSSADARLVARTFPAAADREAIGQGTYDPATGQNQPYLIAGKKVRPQLSPMFTSRIDIPGEIRCRDLRAGC